MARRPRVYIANRGSHDYRPAMKFGELVFVTTDIINKFAVGDLVRQFTSAMKDSQEDDFFLPTALPILAAIGAGILATKYGKVNLLVWKRDAYIVRTIDFQTALELRDYGTEPQVSEDTSS